MKLTWKSYREEEMPWKAQDYHRIYSAFWLLMPIRFKECTVLSNIRNTDNVVKTIIQGKY